MLSAGVRVPDADYFPRLREICDSYNVLLIFDEIITGFGRTGQLSPPRRSAPGRTSSPAARASAAAMPRSRRSSSTTRWPSAFWGEPAQGVQFFSGHTFGGNPVACAVGEAASATCSTTTWSPSRSGRRLPGRRSLRELGAASPSSRRCAASA